MAKKWTVIIDDHPYVEDGNYTFDNITKLETFIGDNDIQIDHVTEIIKNDTMEKTRISYSISEVVPVSAIRLILEVNRRALSHDKSCNNCPVKAVNK